MSSNPQNSNTQPEQPGLIAGHAEYIKGAAESAIGSVMGSHAWATSGEQDKAHAKASLQAATENRNPETQGYGKAEEIAGRVTGCQGMRNEGVKSQGKKDD
ncbi:hypothetical protein B0H67DRAFT_597759 [Lasiosphaeris hirsuta]|uniref:Uncharacterized protein n=1 Tax=Lasiosphaeris hirsuta TaxID=260670 RepID=A0AA40BD79_9PEZI|nr:hypothetical protein B0H67DRAFT_597759 [Lasiosphaeris hirsuta]